MNKKRFRLLVMVMLLVLVCCKSIYAQAMVRVRVEGAEKTLLDSDVSANTFLEAVQKAGERENIDILVRQDKKKKEIYSIDGIQNGIYENNDGWRAFLIRKEAVIQSENLLDVTLQPKDEVIVYYGDAKTIIVPKLEKTIENGKLLLTAKNQYVQWSNENGRALSTQVTQPVANVMVNLSTPDGLVQIAQTDQNGRVSFDCQKTGYYEYYAQGYQENGVPIIVKIPVERFLNAVEDESSITRGEFAAFFSHEAGLTATTSKILFSDIKEHKNNMEITAVVESGFMSGDIDGKFYPDKKITKLEAYVVLARYYGQKFSIYPIEEQFLNQPIWAQESLSIARQLGLFKETDDLEGSLSVEQLNQMFRIVKQRQ